MKDSSLPSDSPSWFSKNQIKTINNKIEQIKAQYSLDKQTAKIYALSSRSVSKYKFLTGEDVILEM